MSALIYNSMLDFQTKGGIDFDTDVFRGMLVTDAYVADRATHDFRNDITNEVVATGYTADGVIVPVTSVKNTGNNTQTITFGLASWPGFLGSAYGIVYYKSRGGSASLDELCVFNRFGLVEIATLGTFVASPTTITMTIRV